MTTKVSDDQIARLINLGYELHIYDVRGEYPDNVSRDKWKYDEIVDILGNRKIAEILVEKYVWCNKLGGKA